MRGIVKFLVGLFTVVLMVGFGIGYVLYGEVNKYISNFIATNPRSEAASDKTWRAYQQYEKKNLQIQSKEGYFLSGTLLLSNIPTADTVIFVHGFSQHRDSGLPYSKMYLDNGYNVLLADYGSDGKRADGKAVSVTWGVREAEDVESWVKILKEQYPEGQVGLHGVSLGAATALIHSGTYGTGKFYVADSAYSDFNEFLMDKAENIAVWGVPLRPYLPVLVPFLNTIVYAHDGIWFYAASPERGLKKTSKPVLLLHGKEDTLIPVSMANRLQQVGNTSRELIVFEGAKHAEERFVSPREYRRQVMEFVLKQQ